MNLNENIEELNTLLVKYGEKNWRIPNVNGISNASSVLRMFGGMGSLNDLYICKANGHKIEKKDEQEVNTRLRELLSSIYEQCATYGKSEITK